MIKTLRITSIIVAVLATAFVVFPVVFGVPPLGVLWSSDEQIEGFLDSAGSIEEFKEARGDEGKGVENQISPLVREAEHFALYLNPPAKSKATTVPDRPIMSHRPAGPVSVKFELFGTSVYPSRPRLSLALIDEPGKGLHWVRQGGKVGHLIIEQIKDGLVVVRDGQRTFELVAERPEKRSLVKGASLEPIRAKPALSPLDRPDVPVMHSPQDASRQMPDGRRRPPRSPADSAITAEEEAAREKVLAELEAMLMAIESGGADSQRGDEEDAAEMEGFMSDIKAMRVSAEEADHLGRLGRQLDDSEPQPQFEDDGTESDANLSEPDFNESDFNEPDFNESDFNELDFNESDFNELDFNESDFNELDFNEPNLD